MRAEYTAKQRALENVYEIRDGSEPDLLQFIDDELDEFADLPSGLPRLFGPPPLFFYTKNLDREVLTMNHSVHWKLGNIPRHDSLWRHAIAESVYKSKIHPGTIYDTKLTISPDICPEEHMASLALKLREPNIVVNYAFRTVTPRTDIESVQSVFLTRVLALVLIEYGDEIIRFGREWGSGYSLSAS
jgi:hypothetical protein